MRARHYDAIVLGRSIGSLFTAALLARRKLRVLLLGQGELPATYRAGDRTLSRRSFSLLSATSPAFRRIVQELAQTQKFRRLTTPLDPMFSLLSQNVRFEVPPDIDLFTREIEREFPEVRQPIAELYSEISRINGLTDAAFEQDAVWPPGNIWERVETGRLAGGLPLVEDETDRSVLLDRLPPAHAFRDVLEVPALFSSHLGLSADELPPLAIARLHGSWTRGVHCLEGGETDLERFLVERIEAHGGVVRLGSRTTRLVVHRGRVVGVQEDGEEEVTGADAVVSSWTGEALADLSSGEGVTRKARDNWPHVEAVGGRFVVSLLADSDAIPVPLGRESFIIPERSDLPVVHLQTAAEGAARLGAAAQHPPAMRLTAEMLLPTAGGIHLLGARAAILETLKTALPFLEEHLQVVDSPNDGLPVWIYEDHEGGRTRREVERVHLPGVSTLAEPMQWRLKVRPMGYLGLAGEPLRGPIAGTYLVGPSVMPALGQEGEVLAAWGVTRILTRKDGSRQKLRRQMWTKIETG